MEMLKLLCYCVGSMSPCVSMYTGVLQVCACLCVYIWLSPWLPPTLLSAVLTQVLSLLFAYRRPVLLSCKHYSIPIWKEGGKLNLKTQNDFHEKNDKPPETVVLTATFNLLGLYSLSVKRLLPENVP
jgi:hypothetical protein